MIRLFALLSLILFTNSGFSQVVEIWEIQGSGAVSSYTGSQVSSNENVVTAVGFDRFFMQCPTDRSDNDSLTSDGIMVYTGPNNPQLSIGDLVNVSGLIIEYENLTEFTNQGLSYETVGTGALPEAVLLNNTFPSSIPQSLSDLERVEGMRVQFENGITTAPTTYNGRTYVTLNGVRPFREMGINFPGEPGLPLWDGNPEVFQIDVKRFLNESPDWYSGTTISGTGVLGYTDYNYVFLPTEYTAEPSLLEQAVRSKEADEVSVASINVYVLDSGDSDYQIRLTKLAKYLIESMRSPDIIAFQEVERIQVLEDLIIRLEELYPQQTNYKAYLFGGSASGFSIRNGYLIDQNLSDISVTQLGENEQISVGGTLHDRPPLLLEANFATTPPTPISVLNIHLRSLNGITGSNPYYVRLKRHEAAISLAQMIQDRQDDNLIVVGDYNAFDFSDGFVDVFAQVSGLPSAGAEYAVEEIVDPALLYHNLLLPETERYSYVYRGNAQTLDHCLSTNLTGIEVTDMAYVRGNSDHPEGMTNNDSAFGISDHDGFILYLKTALTIGIEEPKNVTNFAYPNPFQMGDFLSFELKEAEDISLRLYDMDGRLIYAEDLGLLGAGAHHFEPKLKNQITGMHVFRLVGPKSLQSALVFFP